MCDFQNTPGFEYGNLASAILWDTYIELYGTEQTEAQIQTCVPVRDSSSASYRKNQLLNDVLDREVKRQMK